MNTKAVPGAAAEQHDPLSQLELVVSALLRYGVLLSALTILVGLVLLVVEQGPQAVMTLPRGSGFGAGVAPSSLYDLVGEVSVAHPLAIMDIGLVLLIATPVMRVAASIVAFALERDWLYTAITVFVFAMLMVGFAIGRA